MINKSILVIDDDKSFCEILEDILQLNEHQTHSINNLSQFPETLRAQNYDLIISDIFIGNDSGFDLLKENSTLIKQTPILFMTGFENMEGLQQAMEYPHVKDVLIKPFNLEDFMNIVTKALGDDDNKEKKNDPFLTIPLDAITEDVELEFNLYVKIRDQKYVKVAYKGSMLNKDRLDTYKNHNLENFHIYSEDLLSVLHLGISRLNFTNTDFSHLTQDEKKLFLSIGEPLFEQFNKCESSQELLNESQRFMEFCVSAITKEVHLKSVLNKFALKRNQIYAHSFYVVVLSVAFTKFLNEFDDSDILNIAIAGFLHDIGKLEISKDILKKSEALRSVKENQIYQSHVQLGLEIISKKPNISSTVLEIVMHHHEAFDGSGYPKGLCGKEIPKNSQIVILTNLFTKYLFSETSKFNSFKSSLDSFIKIEKQRVDPILLKKFESFINEIKED